MSLALTLGIGGCVDAVPIRCRRYRPRALRRSSTGLQADAYTISPGDALLITSYYYPQLKQTVSIRPTGAFRCCWSAK